LDAPHRTAPHRTAPHRTAPHRTTHLTSRLCLQLYKEISLREFLQLAWSKKDGKEKGSCKQTSSRVALWPIDLD
jgi:hypothetical protein